MNSVYIGIDLAWGEKNLSGFCVLESNPYTKKLKILDLKLIKSIDEIVDEIQKYKKNLIKILQNIKFQCYPQTENYLQNTALKLEVKCYLKNS